MKVQVEQVAIPVGSTIGYVLGRPTNGDAIVIVAALDWRDAMRLGEELAESAERIVVEIPEWAVIERLENP